MLIVVREALRKAFSVEGAMWSGEGVEALPFVQIFLQINIIFTRHELIEFLLV